MDDKFYRSIIKEQPIGYAYLSVIKDEKGLPVDYEFLDSNSALESLNVFQGVTLNGNRLSWILKEKGNDNFNLKKLYENILSYRGSKETEQYSILNHCNYRITAYALDQDHIVSYFVDTSQETGKNIVAEEDELTRIASRNKFNNALLQEWDRAKRTGHVVSVILMDLDQFKKYNDDYGYIQGDQCLYSIAQTLLREIKRPADLLARYGGEEFAVILPETDLRGAAFIAEHIRKAVMDLAIPYEKSEVEAVVTISLGVSAMRPTHTNTYQDLLELAENALDKAKKTGRNCVFSE